LLKVLEIAYLISLSAEGKLTRRVDSCANASEGIRFCSIANKWWPFLYALGWLEGQKASFLTSKDSSRKKRKTQS
jgi:hypothetical protein